ncbi:hypothetical protein ASD71_04100 [Achromobacter sp. Root565]|nr:hypothetical protein ASD71_04100 [Achromobacter sp. Root565]
MSNAAQAWTVWERTMEEPSDSSRGFDLFSHYREEDPFLQYLVAIANSNSPVELGIIVTSGGFVIGSFDVWRAVL